MSTDTHTLLQIQTHNKINTFLRIMTEYFNLHLEEKQKCAAEHSVANPNRNEQSRILKIFQRSIKTIQRKIFKMQF